MFSKDEILKRLRAGDSADTIAQEMVDTINGAISDYEDEKAAAATNRKAARKAVDALCDYFETIFKDKVPDTDREHLTDVLEVTARPAATDDDVIKAFLNALK